MKTWRKSFGTFSKPAKRDQAVPRAQATGQYPHRAWPRSRNRRRHRPWRLKPSLLQKRVRPPRSSGKRQCLPLSTRSQPKKEMLREQPRSRFVRRSRPELRTRLTKFRRRGRRHIQRLLNFRVRFLGVPSLYNPDLCLRRRDPVRSSQVLDSRFLAERCQAPKEALAHR